jgi:hypothetical protein
MGRRRRRRRRKKTTHRCWWENQLKETIRRTKT